MPEKRPRRKDVHGWGAIAGQQYWIEICEEYYQDVRDYFAGYVKCPQDVEDLVQDVFTRLIQGGHVPRGARVYIRVAAKNRLRSYWRSKNAHLLAEQKIWGQRDKVPPMSTASDLDSDPFDQLSAAESKRALACAVRGLPGAYAEVLRLRITQGLSLDEIAQKVNCSRDTVKKRLQRARRRLLESYRGSDRS